MLTPGPPSPPGPALQPPLHENAQGLLPPKPPALGLHTPFLTQSLSHTLLIEIRPLNISFHFHFSCDYLNHKSYTFLWFKNHTGILEERSKLPSTFSSSLWPHPGDNHCGLFENLSFYIISTDFQLEHSSKMHFQVCCYVYLCIDFNTDNPILRVFHSSCFQCFAVTNNVATTVRAPASLWAPATSAGDSWKLSWWFREAEVAESTELNESS